MRTFTRYNTPASELLLGVLANEASTVSAYQSAMHGLGLELGACVAALLAEEPSAQPICVACTVEDADYLARGMLAGLAVNGVAASRLRLACFWNERVRRLDGMAQDGFDIAPVLKQYREEVALQDAVLVVLKSIISGACVVKTNLASLIQDVLPSRIIVAAPVMLSGAEQRLACEFSPEVAQRFEYLSFARDDEKDPDDMVRPGIGGAVYQRLGLGEAKNKQIPLLVKERRRQAQVRA